MAWNFNNDNPIYIQLINHFKKEIAASVLLPGERFLSVRNLAQEAGVNPNTMQRALAELEKEGLIYAIRTSGRVVTDDETKIRTLRKTLLREQIEEFVTAYLQLGIEEDEIPVLIENYFEEKKAMDKPKRSDSAATE